MPPGAAVPAIPSEFNPTGSGYDVPMENFTARHIHGRPPQAAPESRYIWYGSAKGSQTRRNEKHRLSCASSYRLAGVVGDEIACARLLGYHDLCGFRVAHPVAGPRDASPDGIFKASWPLRHD